MVNKSCKAQTTKIDYSNWSTFGVDHKKPQSPILSLLLIPLCKKFDSITVKIENKRRIIQFCKKLILTFLLRQIKKVGKLKHLKRTGIINDKKIAGKIEQLCRN